MGKVVNVKEPVTLKEVYQIINKASEAGADIEEFEGVLNDNYIIQDAEAVQIDEREPTEYIVLLAEFETSWSNSLYLIRTNNYDVVKHYDNIFNN
jgi:hypothetical protein